MKKRSVSSVLAERRRQRAAVTPSKFSVRHVKFTPEEMAYDPSPEETADWVPVGRGPGAMFAKPSREALAIWKRELERRKGYVRLDSDLRKAFPSDDLVNQALRKIIEIRALPVGTKRKKTA
ncbi:MAG: hypothetical protein WBD40_17300 [Tepidisphaeraceae bacterium]